jgi:branched-chain amino acid transport system ATP-binding protein
MKILELVDVHTYYGESHILNGVSLQIEEGSVVALLGRNGMGKTTTIHSIIGFTPPRHGAIYFKGKDIASLLPYRICQAGLALVPQGRRIFSSLSVKENLIIGERNTKRSGGWSLERVYSTFPILKERASSKGNLLSGGEQQMLCIARALLTNPDLLIMDEPSEGLAPLIVREIGDIISQLKNEGTSILLVEQNLPMALRVSDYVYILSKGEIVYQCTPVELSGNREIQGKYLAVESVSASKR